ncbi:MAG: prolyl oligopeptidase family serine peptidase, partial [Theionarchaea archaeon]|nr:prolyl oligopeptidase family serine peptidase [Theionarchaea archaeon]
MVIENYLTFLPFNQFQSTTEPLIIEILVAGSTIKRRKKYWWLHGGPADICLNNFDPVIQYFALNGFAVFAPNFRGSQGYGKEFERLNWNDLGGGDLRDVREGIFHL